MGPRRRNHKRNNNHHGSKSSSSKVHSRRGLEPTGHKLDDNVYDDDDEEEEEEEEEVVEVDLDLSLPENQSRHYEYGSGLAGTVTTGNACPNHTCHRGKQPAHHPPGSQHTTTMISGSGKKVLVGDEIPPTGIDGLVVGDNINAATAAAIASGALEEGCLHCQRYSTDIQVRCDECQSYICQQCHWCHEFQANHEIRVCDRCDAFYCRNCDEMDQCDDCGEVVCASCSTLLSCKFCGGGLCEECATACGRCGIVLCSRDAKFAVDCDTCRLSYCLVCLASGSKDPCVRCGHRPSKRMEQLVHLRLKSIYKAFKQSSTTSSSRGPPQGSGGAGGGGCGSHCAAESCSSDPPPGSHHHPTGPTIEELEDGMDPGEFCIYGGDRSSVEDHHLLTGTDPPPHPELLAERFMEEKRKEADAAAEALLAELEEEEEAAKTKKSKKKRKKQRQQKAKQREEEEQQQRQAKKDTGRDEKAVPGPSDQKPGTKTTTPKGDQRASRDNASSTTRASKTDPQKDEAKADAERKDEGLVASSQPPSLSTAPKAEMVPEPEKPAEPKVDPIERRLFECVEEKDIDGIEGILFELKGVPGRAALRKNAKKALKRLRSPAAVPTADEPIHPPPAKAVSMTEVTSAAPLATPASAGDAPPPSGGEASKGALELIRMVSDTNVVGKQPNRAECVMQMSPLVVGWVIGKGGQRIRDLMEESGAKVWIDQEKAKPDEARSVYISGDRKSVDQAVHMIRDTVSKAPIDGAAKYAPGTSIEGPTPAQNPQEAVDRSVGLKAKPLAQEQATLPGIDGRAAAAFSNTVPMVHAPASARTATAAAALQGSMPATGIEHVMTCEARFVPLLIGKRGWAIKDIQDKSGARVDIDQTVTPRQIRISGSKGSVEKAIPMVRDVLNYPHAQLQPSGEFAAPSSGQQLLGVAAALDHHGTLPEELHMESRSHSPLPPSSYVMTGDTKSMISASSSLTSTPEPSTASNNSRVFSMPATAGCLIPPTDYTANVASQLQGPHGTFFPQDMPANLGSTHAGFHHQQNISNHAIYGNGQINMQHTSALSSMPINPTRDQFYGQAPDSNHISMGHGTLHGSFASASFGLNNIGSPNSSKAIHAGSAGLPFGTMGAPHQGGSLPTMGLSRQPMNPDAATRMAGLGQFGEMPNSLQGGGIYLPTARNHKNAQFDQHVASGTTSLWDQKQSIPAYTPPSGLPTGTGLSDLRCELQSDSLQANPGITPDLGPGKSSIPNFGMVAPFDGGSGDEKKAFVPGLEAGTRPDVLDSLRDDARIIDSLFGPTGTTSGVESIGLGVNDGSGLISGFNGLSIGGSGSGGGLWGTSLADLTSDNGTSLYKSQHLNEKEDSSEAAALPRFEPFNLTQDTQQHPSQSRFNWDTTPNS